MLDLAVLVPAYNEQKNLVSILKYKKKYNFFVIDDCSTDGTINLLIKKNIKFIRNSNQLGYEKSLIKGFKYLIKKKFKYICTIDGDGEHPLNSIKKAYIEIKKNKADLIICNRNYKNRISENIISFFFLLRFGLKDPLSGMKIYDTTKLKIIINKISYENFLVDIIYFFKQKKFKVKNFQIKIKKKIGISKVGNTFLIQLKILKLLKFIF